MFPLTEANSSPPGLKTQLTPNTRRAAASKLQPPPQPPHQPPPQPPHQSPPQTPQPNRPTTSTVTNQLTITSQRRSRTH
ncbi:uncharacterized protein EAE98_003166 [Botrytis deweyae]|uniref:Uncharacterized protein n=1 Tax=Botrytis deweyae TaxID=2478750 RepID=A0ABQ7IVU0_9HELO|nr:uncharacterized protein EAE98_003166 [Botrytis deweyae]KAF7935121.1 hypothetical protein EAE98_003166 [Botrytis deweyae]